MKVIILAAGYNTRLTLFSNDKEKPKPLIKIGNETILEHILNKIKNYNEITETFIVTNSYFYDKYNEWKKNYKSRLKIKIINDKTLTNETRLGAVRDINLVLRKEKIKEDILIIGGDNLFNFELNQLFTFFKKNGSTILLNDIKSKQKAKLFGVVKIDKECKITDFVEKPQKPKSTLISTLIYILKKKHLKHFSSFIKLENFDRTGDFIKYLIKKENIYGLKIKNGNWFDIGNNETLELARKIYEK